MRNLITCLFSILLFVNVDAQYFQQKTDYIINCSLDDVEKSITGELQLTYHNNSPKDLTYLYIHLHPNAYKNNETAFAKQMLVLEQEDFLNADEGERGYIDNLDFKDEAGASLRLEYDEENIDIAILYLNKPIKSGEKVVIETTFFVRLPKLFSRSGYSDQVYQVTQWFPRTAVYDNKGWHPMSYLHQGEFYNDFGDYKVSIEVPEGYTLAATGREVRTKGNVHSYEAKDVIDFAWFAGKGFKYESEKIKLENGQDVEVSVYYQPSDEEWSFSLRYAKRALKYFSKKIGDYPYPVMRIVQSGSPAGAGMEYPMITNIELPEMDAMMQMMVDQNEMLDEIIAHEIAHNWFQSRIATNERDHPWMDEGMTSYFEQLYMAKYNEPSAFTEQNKMLETQYIRRGNKIELDFPDADMSELSYYLFYYVYAPKSINYLSEYVGEADFEDVFLEYYRKWGGKHPQPQDFFDLLEEKIDKDVSWFINDVIKEPAIMDYGIVKAQESTFAVKNKVTVKNPFPVAFYSGNTIVKELWYDGFEGTKTFDYPQGLTNITRIEIDKDAITNDYYKGNNAMSLKESGHGEEVMKEELLDTAVIVRSAFPIQWGVYNQEDDRPTFIPLAGYNLYDKLMPGFALHNYDALPSKFEFYVLPMFGLGSKELVGFAGADLNLDANKGWFSQYNLGLHGKSFNYNEVIGNRLLRYVTLKPSVSGDIRSKNDKIDQRISLTLPFNYIETYSSKDQVQFYPNLVYDVSVDKGNNEYGLETKLEYQNYESTSKNQSYLTLEVEADYSTSYQEDKKIDFDFYSGISLLNTRRDFPANGNSRGFFSYVQDADADYEFDGNFVGRSESEGFWTQQIMMDGAKGLLPLSNTLTGKSNDYVISFMMKADLPFNPAPKLFPLKPYLGAGYYEYRPFIQKSWENSENFIFTGGLQLDFLNEAIVIALPLVWNDSGDELEIEDHSVQRTIFSRDRQEILKRFTFSVDLKKLAPRRLDEALSSY